MYPPNWLLCEGGRLLAARGAGFSPICSLRDPLTSLDEFNIASFSRLRQEFRSFRICSMFIQVDFFHDMK